MATRTERFERKPQESPSKATEEPEEEVKFSPEEEASLLAESNSQKSSANALFGKSEFKEAIEAYDKALATCPNYLYYEIAVLKSNVSACYLKLEGWKDAVKAASAAIDCLDKLEGKELEGDKKQDEEEADEEIVSEGATKAEDTSPKGQREADIDRIRAKALLRRAKARSEQGGWGNLQGAEEDYKMLEKMTNLSAMDRKFVRQQLIQLPPRTKAAQETEMAEMMGKLKGFGNSILSNFGLSTDNFQMVKDEKTGGYSLNFNGGAGSS